MRFSSTSRGWIAVSIVCNSGRCKLFYNCGIIPLPFPPVPNAHFEINCGKWLNLAILALCGSFWYMGSILANIVLLCLHNKLDENFELLGASSTRPT